MSKLELRWHGHACFTLTCDGYTVAFDPYEDNYVPGFGALDIAADLVLCSHEHKDHNAAHVVKTLTGHENPFTVTKIETFHDAENGLLRGSNTIHLLEAHGLRVAHFGDIGCDLTPAQKSQLQGLDVALIPVGGFYTIGPEQAMDLVDDLQPKVVIPMHYKLGELGLPAVAELEEFLFFAGEYVEYPGSTIEVDGDTEPQIAVLTFDTNI